MMHYPTCFNDLWGWGFLDCPSLVKGECGSKPRGYVVGSEGRGRVSRIHVYNLDLHVKDQTAGRRNLEGKKGKGPAMVSGVSDLNLSLNKFHNKGI